jgi:hypothetical protein
MRMIVDWQQAEKVHRKSEREGSPCIMAGRSLAGNGGIPGMSVIRTSLF